MVWQKGDELRRARVNLPSGDLDSVPRLDEQSDDEVAICVAAGRIGNVWITSVKGATSYNYTSKTSVEEPAAYVAGKFDTGRQVEAKLYLSSSELAHLVKGYGTQPHPRLDSDHARLHPDKAGCTRVAEILGQRLTWTDTWLDQAKDRWEEIRELPQVFIAL